MLGAFSPLAADLVLLIGLLSVLVGDLIAPPGDKRLTAWGAAATLVAALVATFTLDLSGPAWGGTYLGTEVALRFKQIFLAGGLLGVLGSLGSAAVRFTRRQGEYYLLLLCSVLGMSLIAGARDLILLVVSFELMGIPLYVLAAFERRDPLGVEGTLKFVLTGAVSSAVMLFGLSLLFGLAGTTGITEIGAHLVAQPSPLAMLGASLALAGIGFKLGLFPFHQWLPDTYEGSTTPFVAFLSAGPKVAALAVLVQLLVRGERPAVEVMAPAIVGLATLTLLIGNFAALNQHNVKRLLAYSGVAHMGFFLMAIVAGPGLGLSSLLYYAASYLFTNVGAFLVVHAVHQAGGNDSVKSFDGLGQRSGWLALCMLAFLLSLAGIPFVSGFWAKLFVFMAAWEAGLEWLVVLGALLSVLALFYYLRVARAMFMNPPEDSRAVEADWGSNLAIAICLLFVVIMGLWPQPFLSATGLL